MAIQLNETKEMLSKLTPFQLFRLIALFVIIALSLASAVVCGMLNLIE